MKSPEPLVTVICLCYNHQRFVEEAISSVIRQTYPNIQIVLVDDASTDDSRRVIEAILKRHPRIEAVMLRTNAGNCRAFNKGLALAKGAFIVDFATDDVMVPDRISRQVAHFMTLNDSYGVVFTDAEYIDIDGKKIRDHYEYLFRKRLIAGIPQGDVYQDILKKYFIASPTMMIRTAVMRRLGGYDERLGYEDFDFWVRSSRICKYAFLDEKLTRIRRVPGSLSRRSHKPGDRQLYSTYLVCRKAMKLGRSKGDTDALAARLKYELRQSVFSGNYREAGLFYELLKELGRRDRADDFFLMLNKMRLPLSGLRNIYHRLRYG